MIVAKVSAVPGEVDLANNEKSVRFNCASNDSGVVTLYKSDVPVHGWIALQAYKKLNDGSPLKDELGNYLPKSDTDAFYSHSFSIPSGWSADEDQVDYSSTNTAVIEGAWEEDEPVSDSIDHFWNPSGGYDYGLLWPLGRSALEVAQDHLAQAEAAYTGTSPDVAAAYYYIVSLNQGHIMVTLPKPRISATGARRALH